MKNLIILSLAAFCGMSLLTGCIGLSFGGGTRTETETRKATVGQQLIDLQKAKDAGAINDAEYQAQKSKLLHSN